ncbi:ferritin-like domain-containing protein [Pseudoteredinibacter isoporae]|uniref:Ferritin n=1 Tax=Pseudoteredinibacter isoporae TaxID=570281 RepID=A0A7X0MUQ2_9GAMM|nr:ferritin-like domain-containing protein [Pseudoteredinibacter isoporae]MBB6520533.1 hypothetical protein [Pseudoteredinibacter isoporae]
MPAKFVDETPRSVYFYSRAAAITVDDDIPLTEQDVDDVAEIFQTPLTGSYNWDYKLQEGRIKQLYELGKKLNWNVESDLDWDKPVTLLPDEVRAKVGGFSGFEPFEQLSEAKKNEFLDHCDAWRLAQFLHGEQGALLVASQLVSCAPTFNAKLYAGSQTFDEARHVEVFNKFIQEKLGVMYPVNYALKGILDKILTDERWDLKFIGMQVVIEGLALAAFTSMHDRLPEGGLLKDILNYVIRDEARHVAFGIHYLEEFVKSLSDEEREERAQFAYEACVVSRERLIPTDVFEYYGWDVEDARQAFLAGEGNTNFRNHLFQRVIPNLRRIGLLTDKIRPKFDELGVLEYENMIDDGDIDWAEMSRPLDQLN